MSDDLPFDLDGIGLTIDDLDLDDIGLQPLPLDRPKWASREHWMTTDAESYLGDYPIFDSHADRARWFIERMGRAALATMKAGEVDAVLPHGDRLVSLGDLLASVDEIEIMQRR